MRMPQIKSREKASHHSNCKATPRCVRNGVEKESRVEKRKDRRIGIFTLLLLQPFLYLCCNGQPKILPAAKVGVSIYSLPLLSFNIGPTTFFNFPKLWHVSHLWIQLTCFSINTIKKKKRKKKNPNFLKVLEKKKPKLVWYWELVKMVQLLLCEKSPNKAASSRTQIWVFQNFPSPRRRLHYVYIFESECEIPPLQTQ